MIVSPPAAASASCRQQVGVNAFRGYMRDLGDPEDIATTPRIWKILTITSGNWAAAAALHSRQLRPLFFRHLDGSVTRDVSGSAIGATPDATDKRVT